MNINKVDLVKELQKAKKKEKPELLSEVNDLLQKEANRDESIFNTLRKKPIDGLIYKDDLGDDNLFSLEQIKNICIKYRLRFLDSSVFKGEIPYEAIAKIKALERQFNRPLNNFKIVAPKELFHLEDKDSDPLLFLKVDENTYYFIHKWGGELNRFRSLLAFPLRNFMSMFWFLMGVAFIFSLAVPTPDWGMFAFLFVHSFIAICGLACMIVFTLRENFSNVEWDSKYLS